VSKKLLSLAGLGIAAVFILLAVRFILSGDEDTWICDRGQWVRHGNPSSPVPQTNCPVGF
jgi:hypothetical protein